MFITQKGTLIISIFILPQNVGGTFDIVSPTWKNVGGGGGRVPPSPPPDLRPCSSVFCHTPDPWPEM